MGVLATQEVEFTSVSDAAESVERWANSSCRTIVLVSDIDSLTRLCEAAPTIRRVNLGGVHHERDRRLHLPYLFLDDREVDQLRALAERGLEISAQDLPTAARVNLEDLL